MHSLKKLTWVALAEHTGLSTTTLRTLKDEHGAPATPDPDLWDKWLTEHPEHGIGGNRVSKDREHWLTKSAEQRFRLLSIERMKADREIVLVADLALRDDRIARSQRAMLYEVFTNELPVLAAGKSAVEIRSLCRDACDRVCAIMHAKLNDWAASSGEE